MHPGVTAMLTCFPLDVVRTRIMAAPIGSMPTPLALMQNIARSEVSPTVSSLTPEGASGRHG
jgi:hypothetical protein